MTDLGKPAWIYTYSLMRKFWHPYWFYPVYGNYARPLEYACAEHERLPNIADCPPVGPVYNQFGGDLNKYENEMIAKFLTAEVSLAAWDDYVKTCQIMYHADEGNKEIYDDLKADGCSSRLAAEWTRVFAERLRISTSKWYNRTSPCGIIIAAHTVFGRE